ncbi:MAG: acetyl-CoA carboxylase, carboxyltransferase subunit beta [Phycisphaerales bacterium]
MPRRDRGATPRQWRDVPEGQRKRTSIPEGLWMRCVCCGEMIFRQQMEANLHVCPQCGHHYRISARQRVEQLCDPGSFEPIDEQVISVDPLEFTDLKKYPDRLDAERAKTGRPEGALAGRAFIKGRRVVLAVLDLTFMMGSMGSAVGEKVTRAIEAAIEQDLPLVIVSASGGARMQESCLSLMQMAKTSAALARLDEAGGLFISVLTDPTTGGVTASFAMLGDLILAEPGALIGFAGPRVIKQTIRQDLPDGFQRAEFLKKAGFVDRVVPRPELRSEISRIIDYAGK